MESEIEILKKRIAELEAQNVQKEAVIERPAIVREAVGEHLKKTQEEVLPKERHVPTQAIQAQIKKVFDLKSTDAQHKELVDELLRFASEKGIVNAAAVVQQVDDPHLVDDFAAALTQQIIKMI